jgi:hypothetical protein
MPDLPDDVVALKEHIRRLESRLEEALRERAESDEIRTAVADSAASAAGTTVRALDELVVLQIVVDAAVEWRKAAARRSSDVNQVEFRSRIVNLRAVVDGYLARTAVRS